MDDAHDIEVARNEIDALRRREQELSALFSSARELAGVRDADAVLVRLVERAHEMLAGDVTYLSEFDPRTRELRVRTTNGSVSAAFRDLVVPPGRGLVSEIVETRMPRAVSRYDDYLRERHEAIIDDAVAAEGIVSMLGVPLRTESTVLGVLFVAMRRERRFAPEQIALLSALADHASVVLQTAATLRDLRRSEDEARQALAQLTGHLAERDRANAVHQDLVNAVLGGGGFAPVAQTLASSLGRGVRIIDGQGQNRAAAGEVAGLQGVDGELSVRAAIESSRASGHATVAVADAGRLTVAALAAGARLFGAVIIGGGAGGEGSPGEGGRGVGGDEDLGPVDLRTIERAAQVGALLALAEEAVAEAEHRQQADLVGDILTGDGESRPDVLVRLRRLGLDVSQLDHVTVFTVSGDRRLDAARVISREVGPAGLVGQLDGLIVVLGDSTRIPGAAAEAWRSTTVDAVGGDVLAVSAPVSDESVSQRFDSARRASRLLRALGVSDGALPADEVLPYAAVLDADQRSLAAFLDLTIGPVRRYDAERGSELLATLRAFIRNGASPTRTARALTFHPNTILQRLDRLDRVLGEGWRSDERLFRISMAVRLDEIRERVAPDAR